MLNWKDGDKISSFNAEGCWAKFRYGKEQLEVFMTISSNAIAVAISSDNCTFSKTWKEKNIPLDQIKEEIDIFLEESSRKLTL